jgi:hypothetical protein
MDRRRVLKQMIWMGAGIAFLPSCVYKQDQVSIQLKKIQISPKQEKFLASLANMIIPATNTPGAGDTGAHLYALKMIDDCYEQSGRQKMIDGMKKVQSSLEENENRTLENLAKENDPDISFFMNEYKSLVTKGYTTSEYFMTKLVPYKLVPGPYKACVSVSSLANK